MNDFRIEEVVESALPDEGTNNDDGGPEESQEPFATLAEKLAQVEASIAEKQAEIKDAEESVENNQKKVQQTNIELRTLEVEKASLERTQKDVDDARKAIAAHRQEAQATVQAGTDFLTDVRQRLQNRLTAVGRTKIANEDMRLDPLREKIKKREQEIAETEEAVFQLKNGLALLNTFLQRAKTKLLQLPAQSQSAKGQLENQKKGIEAALADGRGSEVYLLTLDMERALENLADAVDETREIDLLNDLDQLWQEAFKTNKTLAEQQAKLLELQTQQALSKSNLRTDELERKQKILQALDNDQPS